MNLIKFHWINLQINFGHSKYILIYITKASQQKDIAFKNHTMCLKFPLYYQDTFRMKRKLKLYVMNRGKNCIQRFSLNSSLETRV